jgi:hypothetical protein
MQQWAVKQMNAARWVALLVVSAIGETVAFVFAIVFGVSAFGQTDAAERSRLWASAGLWLLATAACTAVSVWSLVRLLRIVAEQAPGPPPGTPPG